jgi:4-amino-4-deoxy-L-arabinose transferase-like glycosyltransferase
MVAEAVMKYRVNKKTNALGIAGLVALLIGILLLYNFQQNGGEWSRILGLIVIATGAVAFIVFTVLSVLVIKAANGVRKRQKAAPVNPYIDYAKVLEEIRANYKADADRGKNVVKVHKDRVAKAVRPLMDYGVCNVGEVYYAGLVMANNALFSNRLLSAVLAPAAILYGTEPYFAENPRKLQEYAEMLFEMREQADREKSMNHVPDNLKAIVADLIAEDRYAYNVVLPADFCEGHTVYYTTVLIHRAQFPTYMIADGLFPIVASPATHKTVFVVEYIYWPDDFAAEFLNHARIEAEKLIEDTLKAEPNS